MANAREPIPGLMGLRAFACLAVFGVHWQQLTGVEGSWGPFDIKVLLLNGNTGVCLFFLLSGLLLSWPTWQRMSAAAPAPVGHRQNYLRRYTVNRAARILPAYYLCLTILILVGQQWRHWNGVRSIVLHYLFLHNISTSTLYDISVPFWTLAVQAQFYVLLPLLLLALSRSTNQQRALAAVVLACVGAYALHFVLAEWVGPHMPSILRKLFTGRVGEHSMLAHLSHFLLGILAAGIHVRLIAAPPGGIAAHPRFWGVVFWGSLAACLLILATPALDEAFQLPHGRYNWPYIPCLLAAMVLAVPRCRSACTVLQALPVRGLGIISYGFYVFHLPCMKLVSRNADKLGKFAAENPIGLAVTSFLVAIGVATASWYFIERPILQWVKRGRAGSRAQANHAIGILGRSSHGDPTRRLLTRLLWLAVSIGCMAILIQAILHAPRIPYNVRELFKPDLRPLRIIVFSALLIWVGLAPSWFGARISRRPWLIWLVPVWAILVGQGMWFLLRNSVTIESRKDILGSLLLDWPGNLEYCMRLWTLQGPLTIFLIFFSATYHTWQQQRMEPAARRIGYYAAASLPWTVVCACVVFCWPSTNNIVELIRFTPFPWIGPVALLALTALVAGNATWLSQASSHDMRDRFVRLLVTVGLVLPGWGLLHIGLNPAVEKYGLVFPAARFLLGPDRAQEISWLELFARWGVLQVGGVLVLAWGGVIARRLSGLQTEEANSPP